MVTAVTLDVRVTYHIAKIDYNDRKYISTAVGVLVKSTIDRPLTNRFALLLSPSAMVYLGEFQNCVPRRERYEPASPLLPQSVDRPLFSGCFYLKLGIRSHGKCSSH